MNIARPFHRTIVFLAACVLLAGASANAGEAPAASPEREAELLTILRSGAPAGERAIACKLLAIHGSSNAVPDLAPLLSDERLASWARIALEAIPGAEADEALRTATGSLQGKLLVGVINSIGVRRDAQAVDLLTERLGDEDAEVAKAAAVALGHVGNPAAADALRQALAAAREDVRSAAAEGCVLCAEALLSQGKSAAATEIYDEIRGADVPQQRILEATRGAILARGQEGIPLLLEQLRSPDKRLFQIALSTAREFPGGEVDEALADEMANAEPPQAALIIQAMADRTETVVLPAVLQAARHGPKQVRLSALDALRRVGDASCLNALLEIALATDAELSQSAKVALAELPGESVDAQIVAMLPEAEGKMRPVLIELAGRRRVEATATLVEALDDSDPAVRAAALAALGETIGPQDLPVLIAQVVAPQDPQDAAAAEQALETASIRMPDREACAGQLAAALDQVPKSAKPALVETLAAVGGTKALETIAAVARGQDPELQDLATRLLGEWTTADAAPVLLELAKSAGDPRYQVRALRGYIRIARQFVLSDEERAEMCRAALDAARRDAERDLVWEVLERYPSLHTLRVAVEAAKVSPPAAPAARTARAIAEKMGDSREVQGLLAQLDESGG